VIVLLLPLLVGFGLARLEREKAPTWSLGAAIGLIIGIVPLLLLYIARRQRFYLTINGVFNKIFFNK